MKVIHLIHTIFLSLFLSNLAAQDKLLIQTNADSLDTYVYSKDYYLGKTDDRKTFKINELEKIFICKKGYRSAFIESNRQSKIDDTLLNMTKSWTNLKLDSLGKFVFGGVTLDRSTKDYLPDNLKFYSQQYSELIGSKLKNLLDTGVVIPPFNDTSNYEIPGNVKYELTGVLNHQEIYGLKESMIKAKHLAVFTQTKWTLYDRDLEQIIYSRTHYGLIFHGKIGYDKNSIEISKNGMRLHVAKQNSILMTIDQLLSDPQFVDNCSYYELEEPFKNIEGPISMSLPSSKSNSLSEVVNGVVTIRTNSGFGSGFIISSDGYLLTNYHVTKDMGPLKVIFNNGEEVDAQRVKILKSSDLALIKVEPQNLTSLELCQKYTIGEDVYAIGTAANEILSQSITKGIVSGNRTLDSLNLIQTDAAVNSGNSGGPLLNKKLQVIGIVSMKIVGTSVEGVGFAIPINEALEKLEINLVE